MHRREETQGNAQPKHRGCGCGDDHSKEGLSGGESGKSGCKCKGLLKYRRIHSFCGLLIGLFLCEHLFAMCLGLCPQWFDRYAAQLHAFAPRALFLEVTGILVPLLAMTPIGLYLLWGHGVKYNVSKCNRGNKLQFFLQRVSAVVLLAFIVFHLCTLHPWGIRLLENRLMGNTIVAAPAESLYALTVANVRTWHCGTSSPNSINGAVIVFYLVGTLATVFHLANGLWTGAIAWNAVQLPATKRRWGIICCMFGIALGLLGIVGWAAFTICPSI